jgi:hypothetical protein
VLPIVFFGPCIPTWRPNNQSLCVDALNIGIWTTMPLHHLSLVNGGLHSRCGLDQWGRNQAKHTISNPQPAMKNIKLNLASSISKVRIHVPYRTIYKYVPCIPPETTFWSPGPQHREKVMSEKLSMCFWLVMRWDGMEYTHPLFFSMWHSTWGMPLLHESTQHTSRRHPSFEENISL